MTVLSDGRVLVAGGVSASSVRDSAETYDPSTGTWTVTGSLPSGISNAQTALLPDGRVLLAGGADESGTYVAQADLYDPTSGQWTATGSMNEPRGGFTLTTLPDGDVLAADGWTSGSCPCFATSAELYDAGTGDWNPTGGTTPERAEATATLLPDGDVLVAGGLDGSAALDSAESYDPATATWAPAGTLADVRTEQTATLLPDGKVLLAGGNDGPQGGSGVTQNLATAELAFAPEASVTSGPGTFTNSTTATFDLASTEPDSTFTCALDGGAASPCSSPASYSALSPGAHVLSITATDTTGLTQPTPTEFGPGDKRHHAASGGRRGHSVGGSRHRDRPPLRRPRPRGQPGPGADGAGVIRLVGG